MRTDEARLALGVGGIVHVHARLEAVQRQAAAAGAGVRRRRCRRRRLLRAERGRCSVRHAHGRRATPQAARFARRRAEEVSARAPGALGAIAPISPI